MDGDLGFGTVVERDALLGGTETEGTVALGGDLTFGPGYSVMTRPTGTYYAPGEDRPTALLVGGRILTSGSSPQGVLRIENNGYMHVQNTDGIRELVANVKGAAARSAEVVGSGAGYGSMPRVQLTSGQSPARLSLPTRPIDFTALFTEYRWRALRIAACADNVTLTDVGGTPLPAQGGVRPGTRAYVTLTSGKTNVLRLTGKDLANLAELSFRTAPSAETPFVVVVNPVAGAYSWRVPALTGVSSAQAPYMLWDFPGVADVTLAGGGTLVGTLYAPNAHLTDLDRDGVDGDIAAESFQAGVLGAQGGYGDAGVIRHFPFGARLSCVAGQQLPLSPAASGAERIRTSTHVHGLASDELGDAGDTGAAGSHVATVHHELAQTGVGHGRLVSLGLAAAAAVCGGGVALMLGLVRRRRSL
jgi:choice-of-anchor A domain-containing protein